MIVCIDLRGQENALFTHAFTFYFVKNKTFALFDGKQAWDSWEDFLDSFIAHFGEKSLDDLGAAAKERIEEFKNACPEWVFELSKHINYEYKIEVNEGTTVKELYDKVLEYCWSYDQAPQYLKLRTDDHKIIVDLPVDEDEEDTWESGLGEEDEDAEEEQ